MKVRWFFKKKSMMAAEEPFSKPGRENYISKEIRLTTEQTLVPYDEICLACGKREYIPEGSMICYECRKMS